MENHDADYPHKENHKEDKWKPPAQHEYHSFHVNEEIDPTTFEIPNDELSINVGIFESALKEFLNVRKAVMSALKSAGPVDNNGRITIPRLRGQGKPTVVEWMEKRGVIGGYEMRDANGNVIQSSQSSNLTLEESAKEQHWQKEPGSSDLAA